MSKKVVFSFLLFLFAFQFFAKAQTTWPMPGAKWRYCSYGFMMSPWDKTGSYIEFAYTKDTLISDTTYQVIKATGGKTLGDIYARTLVDWIPPSDNSLTHFTRYSNDTVYKRVYNKEYVFMLFNANLGSVFNNFRQRNTNLFNDSACTAKMPLRVTGISLSAISGVELKVFTVDDTLFNDVLSGFSSNYSKSYTYIERIGITSDIFFTEPCFETDFNNTSCSRAVDCWGYSLTKYEDADATFIYGSDYYCKPSSISESKINQISIYPNPAENELFFEIDNITNPLTLSIYNNLGELVFTKNNIFGSQKIDISHLQNGIYFVSLFNEKTSQSHFKTKLIVNKSN